MLSHLGLGGDGDEIAAVEDVEHEFGIRMNTRGAGSWWTVGDVYDALVVDLPVEVSAHPGTWLRFCRALCLGTADQPELVAHETILICPQWSLVDQVKSFFRR